jgi:multiple sugar transport system permease protein
MHASIHSSPRLKSATGWLILAVLLFPLYWMTNASLQPHEALRGASPSWYPDPLVLANYLAVLGTQGQNILTSCIVAGGTAVLSLLIAAPCAYALVVFRLRWSTFLVLLLLLAQMLPHVVMANALYAIYARIGLLNSYSGLVLADSTMGVPFAILILRAFMVSLPRSLVEAALCDGAGYWGAFFRIVLPLSRNGLITAGLFCFLFAWSDFIFALTMGTKQKVVPITLGIYQYIGTHQTDWNAIMATAVLASIPPVVLLLIGQRHITAGLTGGAVKE